MTINEGDTVLIGNGDVHWIVVTIEDRIDPLGVLLKSGLTGVHRRESYENLHPYRRVGD